MSAFAALVVLVVYFLWGQYDLYLFAKWLKQYRAVPLPDKPTLCPEKDVSLIVCTLDPPARFLPCLHQWLANNPLEIIICTTAQYMNTVCALIESADGLTGADMKKIHIIETDKQGARPQFITAVKIARGSIIARSDDHITWGSELFLKHMLAPLDPASDAADPAIAAVMPPTETWIDPSRRNAASANAWETAATRGVDGRNGNVNAVWAGQKWSICLVGLSFLIRAEVVKDPVFQKAFLNDYWRGVPFDAGDDCFLTRWLQRYSLLIAAQAVPETTVYRTVKLTRAFVPQMLRWERSTIQSFLRTLVEVPQIWTARGDPWVVRTTLQRNLRPVLTAIHLWAWLTAFFTGGFWTAAGAGLLLGWYVRLAVPGHRAFFRKYPWMVRYWWAAVLREFAYVVQDPIAWATLSDNTWKRGESA